MTEEDYTEAWIVRLYETIDIKDNQIKHLEAKVEALSKLKDKV